MQYLFLIYFSAVLSVGQPSPRLEKTYNTLNAKVGLSNIKLKVASGDRSLNAWTNGSSITVTEGLLSVPSNEFAFVVGHEMAHIVYGSDEAYADSMSVKILQASGKYNACSGGVGFFKRLLRVDGDTGGGLDPHPKTSVRLKMIQRLAC
jgi:predicted Zn-dependent protease